MRKERVDVRVETELLDELDAIASRLGLGSRSAAIREAIASFVMEHKDGWNSTGIRVNIPNRLAERVNMRILNGDALDFDDAVRMAISSWVSALEDFHLNRKVLLEKDITENRRRDSAVREMETTAREITRRR